MALEVSRTRLGFATAGAPAAMKLSGTLRKHHGIRTSEHVINQSESAPVASLPPPHMAIRFRQ